MEIDAAPLRADPALVVDRSFLVPPPEDLPRRVAFRGPVAVHAVLRTLGNSIRADVEAHARCESPCDRCLTPVPLQLNVAYGEEFLTPDQAARDGLAGAEEDDGEVRRAVYRDNVIDLGPGLWQNLDLAVPPKALCRPECKGLCPRCGKDLNRGPCGCGDDARDRVDPRLAALGEVMQRLESTRGEAAGPEARARGGRRAGAGPRSLERAARGDNRDPSAATTPLPRRPRQGG